MDTLKSLEKAVFDKAPLPDEINDFTLWYEVWEGSKFTDDQPSPTQCLLAVWFCQSPRTLIDILDIVARKYPAYYLPSIMPYAIAKAIVEQWPDVATSLIANAAERRIPFGAVIEALITMPRESFVGRFDPRAQMLPARQPYQLR